MREKLIELIQTAKSKRQHDFFIGDIDDAIDLESDDEYIADHLIANGVTIQQWIPVTEGMPKTIPCGAGTEYSEAVNVLTSGRKVITAIWNGLHWICDAEFWDAEFEEITHWTPVILPLPEPPKEG